MGNASRKRTKDPWRRGLENAVPDLLYQLSPPVPLDHVHLTRADHLIQVADTIWSEVTLKRLCWRSSIRIPLTATFSPSYLEGLKTLIPNSRYCWLPNGLAFAAFKATDEVDWVSDTTGRPRQLEGVESAKRRLSKPRMIERDVDSEDESWPSPVRACPRRQRPLSNERECGESSYAVGSGSSLRPLA